MSNLNELKKLWRELLIGGLIVALFIQPWMPYMKYKLLEIQEWFTWTSVVHANREVVCDHECNMKRWVELRTDELYNEAYNENMQTARYKALLELNDMIQGLATDTATYPQ